VDQIVYESVDEYPLPDEDKSPDKTIVVISRQEGINYLILDGKSPDPLDGDRVAAAVIEEVESLWHTLDWIIDSSVVWNRLDEFRQRSIWITLEGLGRDLYQRFIPKRLHQEAEKWKPGTIITLVTNEKWIPWELLHDGQEFWGNKFVLARLPKIPELGLLSRPDYLLSRAGDDRAGRVVHVIGGEIGPKLITRARGLFSPFGSRIAVALTPRKGLQSQRSAIVLPTLAWFTLLVMVMLSPECVSSSLKTDQTTQRRP
jgi:hypothetical protein